MSARATEHLKETPLSADWQLTGLGNAMAHIKATVQLTYRFRWWLFGFGPDVEVIQPVSLRNERKGRFRAALVWYGA